MNSFIPPINPEREALSQATMALRAPGMNYIPNYYYYLPAEQIAEIVKKYRAIRDDLDERIQAIDQGEKVASWKLVPLTFYKVHCGACHQETTKEAQNTEEAVKVMESYGWHMGKKGPLCPYCDETDEEMEALKPR